MVFLSLSSSTLSTSLTSTSFVLLSSNALLPPCTYSFLTVMLLYSPEETRPSLCHNYILAWIISQLNELSRSRQPLRPILLSFLSSLYILVIWCSLCWNKKRNLWIWLENILSFRHSFINFPRKYDFCRPCFKFGKVYNSGGCNPVNWLSQTRRNLTIEFLD